MTEIENWLFDLMEALNDSMYFLLSIAIIHDFLYVANLWENRCSALNQGDWKVGILIGLVSQRNILNMQHNLEYKHERFNVI